jgi:glycosyltransferase involved in cell wall biosynthesis
MRLLYFVHDYPLGTSEFFPHLECRYLAEAFDEILIIPWEIPDRGARSVFPLPPNARVCPEPALRRIEDVNRRGASRRTLLGEGSTAVIRELLCRLGSGSTQVIGDWVSASRFRHHLQALVPIRTGDLLYSFWLTPSALTISEIRSRRGDVRAIARAHGYDLYWERSGGRPPPFQERMIERLDGVFPCSLHGTRYLGAKYPSRSSKIDVAHLGIEPATAPARASSDGTLRIVTCSAINKVKRLSMLVRALRLVSRRIRWTHIGDGPSATDLRAEAESLPPAVEARFLGRLPNEKVREFYRSEPVDLFVNVSSSEGLPVAVMEAMSHGIPVCATAVGGTPEIVDSSAGYLLPAGFVPPDLTAILERHPIGSSAMRKRAAEIQRTRFDAETNFAAFAARLKAIAGGR